jgi:hypothetical protein
LSLGIIKQIIPVIAHRQAVVLAALKVPYFLLSEEIVEATDLWDVPPGEEKPEFVES